MKKYFGKLCLGGVLLFSLSMSLTSCDPYLDDILGEWSRPTPGGGSSSDETTPTMKATSLTLEAITAGTIVVKNPQAGMQYSKNGGAKTAITDNPTEITVAVGDKVQFYGKGTDITAYYSNDSNPSNDTNISGGTAQVKVYGNIMSLVDETGYEAATKLTGDFAFYGLFNGNTMLTDISDLQLPATNLTNRCYQNMFNGCTSLTTIPEALLPATTLTDNCYQSMFCGCKGLTTLPEKLLPATEMKESCYASMFMSCTGLTTVPEKLLPAEKLARNCYQSMFNSCASLTTAPALPATNLANNCYMQMFSGCKGLTTAPKLPATTLKEGCYSSMFLGCTSLTTTPKLPAETLVKECYDWMFYQCTGLNSVTCLATDISADNCTNYWLYGVSGTGTFTKASSMTSWTTGVSGIPAGWTVNSAP